MPKFNVKYVDSITEPGANLILAERSHETLVQSILKRIDISVEKHGSIGIAVGGHHDCAGNPVTYEEQKRHIMSGIAYLGNQYRDIPIIGLWVDENWRVHEIG